MLNESKGTPDIVREIIIENSNNINSIISKKVNQTLKININREVKQEKRIVSLNCNLSINFHFKNIKNYNGSINFKECIDSLFSNCEINLYIPNMNISKLKVYKSLSHELTHLYELYQIKDLFNRSSWIKSLNLNNFDKLNLNIGLIQYFRDIFYASLPHEIRANLSSLEVFLIGLMSNDESYLRSELEKTTEWSRYKAISDFNPDLFLKDLIMKYNLNFVLRAFNLFNKVLDIKSKKINNYDDLNKYFKNWKRYFSDISKKYKHKIDSKIKEIVNKDTNNDKYGIEIYEDKILKYNDYLNNKQNNREIKLDELLKIDYKDYFESWNPTLNKEVKNYVEMNKYNLPELWNNELSEDENIDFMINYFTKYPDQMRTREYKIKSTKRDGDFRNNVPIVQNIGGVEDFRTFNSSF
jgi:hypothetical protein